MSQRIDVSQTLTDLHAAGTADDFVVSDYGQLGDWPLISLCRRPEYTKQSKNIYLSAGIHGDEPAGPIALLEILREQALPEGHAYFICPLMNPAGMDAGTRGNSNGTDLNRDYTQFESTEIGTHRSWMHRQMPSLDLSLHLHEDWESTGFYLYELNMTQSPSLAATMLRAARTHVPIEQATWIDGHRALGGIISPSELPDVPEGLPEAIYVQKHFGGLNYTLESPSALPLKQRVQAIKAAVLAGIATIA